MSNWALNYCWRCGVQLGLDDFDGFCGECGECDECEGAMTYDEREHKTLLLEAYENNYKQVAYLIQTGKYIMPEVFTQFEHYFNQIVILKKELSNGKD